MANKANLGIGMLASAVNTTTTTFQLISGYGQYMPAVPFFATVAPSGQISTRLNSEIVSVTARSTDTLTVVRAQKGTTARSFAANDILANGVYVEDITEKEDVANKSTSTSLGTSDTLYPTQNAVKQYVDTGPVIFSALPSADTLLTNGTAKIIMNTEEVDSHNFYNPSTGVFQPTIPGWYLIGGAINTNNQLTGTKLILYVFKNGAQAKMLSRMTSPANEWAGISGAAMIYLNGSSDYVEIYYYNNANSNYAVAANTHVYGMLARR